MSHEMAPYEPNVLVPFLRKDLLELLFKNISVVDYAALSILLQYAQDTNQEKLYLKDLAAHLELPMDQVSKLARSLQSKGYVRWTHDDGGEEGTYLILDQAALSPALAQKAYLSEFFQKVVQQYGQDRFLNLVGEANALEDVLWQQAWKEEPYDQPTP